MKLIQIPTPYTEKVWPYVLVFIELANVRGHSEQPVEYTFKRLQTGDALLWVVWAEQQKSLMAAATTEIATPVGTDKRMCLITNLGGHSMDLWRHLLPDFEQYAHNENCERIRLYGRQGWSRILREDGYEQPWIALEKRI